MDKKRRRFSGQEKVALLRRHLLEKEPVSDLCERYGLNPNLFYRWQKQFFEQGAAVFERAGDGPKEAGVKKLERQNAQMKAKLAHKDEVIAEIMASHIELKKSLGPD